MTKNKRIKKGIKEMKFINLKGNKRFLINIEAIAFVEETENGCKIHFVDGRNDITTGAKYDDMMAALEDSFGGE